MTRESRLAAILGKSWGFLRGYEKTKEILGNLGRSTQEAMNAFIFEQT